MPHAPRGVLRVLWGACMAALALKSPSGNFLARLIAKGTDCCRLSERAEMRACGALLGVAVLRLGRVVLGC